MTREEAITVLKGLSENPLFSNQHKAAFNIAIHDIKQRHDWDINNLILINKDNYEPLEQEPRWISVGEKLPEPFTFVNATCRSLVDDRENWVVETMYLPIPKEANKHGYSDWGNIPMLNWGEAEVIAWVERIIPQPYKSEVEPQESEDEGA